jgi:tetratricopeptide (TPR) repeat protein
MAVFESEDRSRQKRAKQEQAISLATKGRWEEAARVNREIVELFPNDVDAHNRLGKALMEVGRYSEAREAYARAAKIDPMNSIALKNLQRLTKLGEERTGAPPPTAVDPRLFIEESGKTTVTQLTEVRRKGSLAKLTAGDQLKLETRGNQIAVVDFAGQDIGRIEPRLEQHLVDLLKMGNEYSVFVTSASDNSVNVIVRETHRSPSMGNRPSFRPSAAAEGIRAYTREGALRYELEEEEEELLEEEEEEVEPEAAHVVDADAVEETPLETLAAEEESEEAP